MHIYLYIQHSLRRDLFRISFVMLPGSFVQHLFVHSYVFIYVMYISLAQGAYKTGEKRLMKQILQN